MKPEDIYSVERVLNIKFTLVDGRAKLEVCLVLTNGEAYRLRFNDAREFKLRLKRDSKLNIGEIYLDRTKDGFVLHDECADSIHVEAGADFAMDLLAIDERGRIVG